MEVLTQILTKNLFCLIFSNQNCNRNRASKVQEGKCTYDGKSRNECIIYKSTCTTMDENYLCITQQNFKNHMAGHLINVKNVVCKNVRSISYARYLSNFYE